MKEMLINVSAGQERRLAIVSDGTLEELYIERESTDSHVGNIYKGRVTNIEPSIQAAFIDFGGVRNGFLHISDLQAQYFPKDKRVEEPVGRKASRKDRPSIQDCLKRGQELVCQVIKSGIGTKGPTLTTYLSVPGRFLVMMPGMTRFGVSRKIEDEQQREEMRGLLEQIQPPEDLGFIVRTAGLGHSKRDLQQDLKYLERLWASVNKRLKKGRAPLELYQESDLVIRTIRDVYSTEISRIVCDRHETACRVTDFLKVAMPRGKNKVEVYTGKHPMFDRYGLEQEIENIYSRRVEMPGGASLVIDQTEALVAIDVNSGKNRQNSDAEETAYKINQQAAKEVARQLRLRDMGGVIIIDFIDMRMDRHQREIERILRDEVKKDRAKTKILKISRFGLIEMTRQRMRPSLKRSLFTECPNCSGLGTIKSDESLALSVIRSLQLACTDKRIASIKMRVPHRVAEYLNNSRRSQIANLEDISGKSITINSDDMLAGDEVQIECLDERNGTINWLPDYNKRTPMPSAPADAPANMIGKPPTAKELVDVKHYDEEKHNPWNIAETDEVETAEKSDDHRDSDGDTSDENAEHQVKKKRRRRRRKKKNIDPASPQQTDEQKTDEQNTNQKNSDQRDPAEVSEQSADSTEAAEIETSNNNSDQQNTNNKKRRRRGGRRHRSKKHNTESYDNHQRSDDQDSDIAHEDHQNGDKRDNKESQDSRKIDDRRDNRRSHDNRHKDDRRNNRRSHDDRKIDDRKSHVDQQSDDRHDNNKSRDDQHRNDGRDNRKSDNRRSRSHNQRDDRRRPDRTEAKEDSGINKHNALPQQQTQTDAAQDVTANQSDRSESTQKPATKKAAKRGRRPAAKRAKAKSSDATKDAQATTEAAQNESRQSQATTRPEAETAVTSAAQAKPAAKQETEETPAKTQKKAKAKRKTAKKKKAKTKTAKTSKTAKKAAKTAKKTGVTTQGADEVEAVAAAKTTPKAATAKKKTAKKKTAKKKTTRKKTTKKAKKAAKKAEPTETE